MALSRWTNPTENLWPELKRTVHMGKPKDINNFESFCMEEWMILQIGYPT